MMWGLVLLENVVNCFAGLSLCCLMLALPFVLTAVGCCSKHWLLTVRPLTGGLTYPAWEDW